jgi:23S rRNA (guanosine2251-2'-O)-methyltransferase
MKKDEFIFGYYPVLEALEAGATVDKIFINQASSSKRFDQIISLAQNAGIPVNQVPLAKLDKLTRSNHQGIVAYLSPVSFISLEALVEEAEKSDKNPGLFLILDQLTDARNFGAIIRTAECTGVSGIIIQKTGGAPVNADTVKTSAGAVFNVPICKVDHVKDAIFYLQGSGYTVVGADEKAPQSYFNLDYKAPSAIVMGSEGSGISKSVLNLLDGLISIPMRGKTKSLNVSVAAGAILFEILRQRSI